VSRWSVSGLAGERLRVELRPGSVRLMRRIALSRSRALSDRPIRIEVAKGGSEAAPEPWRASLEAFGSGLRERRGALGRVEVVLSDHFVRYALIPWSESVVSDGDRLALARLSFRVVYGHLSDTWDLSVDQQRAGEASFACAVDRALIGELREMVSLAGGRLESVRPALADCLNSHRHAIRETEFCLATAEPGRITLAFRSRAGWQAVRSRRSEGPPAEALPVLLKQEAAAGPAPDGGVLYLCAADSIEMAPFAVRGWTLIRLADRRKDTERAGDPVFAQERIEPGPDLIRG